jgi:hypothetical protein
MKTQIPDTEPGTDKTGGVGDKGSALPIVRPGPFGGVVVSGPWADYNPPPDIPVVVIVTGGHLATTLDPLKSAEFFDIGSRTWWPMEDLLFRARAGHAATMINRPHPSGYGDLLVAGGVTAPFLPHRKVVDLFHQSTGHWDLFVGALNAPRTSVTLTALEDGRVLVIGGDATCELYDSDTRISTATTGNLHVPRSVHTATYLKRRNLAMGPHVLVVGGVGPAGPTEAVEMYDVRTEQFTMMASYEIAVYGHTANVRPDGTVLVAGGWLSSSDVFLFDPPADTWTRLRSMNHARALHTATTLADGRTLVVGGVGVGGQLETLNTAEIFDGNNWADVHTLELSRAGHTATLLPDGCVLVAGGACTGLCEIFNPSDGGWSLAGALNTNRAEHTATLMGGVRNPFRDVFVNVVEPSLS